MRYGCPGGPNYLNRVNYNSGTTTINTHVTVSGIHSDSKRDKQMYITTMLLMSRGINAHRNINASLIQIPTYNLHLMSKALHHYSPQYESSPPYYTNDH